jgi:hypothetical protein
MYKKITTAHLDVNVDVTCEACGTNYSYVHKINRSILGSIREDKGEQAKSLVKKDLREYRLGWHSCPKCGYRQSWMRKDWDLVRDAISFLSFGILFLILSLIVVDENIWYSKWSILLPFCSFALGGFLGMFFARKYIKMNRIWYKKNGFQKFAPRKPYIRPLD